MAAELVVAAAGAAVAEAVAVFTGVEAAREKLAPMAGEFGVVVAATVDAGALAVFAELEGVSVVCNRCTAAAALNAKQ